MMIRTNNFFAGKVFYVLLSFIFVCCNTFYYPIASDALTDSQLFDAQELYGKRVQQKNASVNKHSGTNFVKSIKSNLLSKSSKSFFSSKTFNSISPKAAQKQYQVQYKFGNSYNVKQFGAKGDGVADDQGAINSAISRATGTGLSVYFPPGNYLHSGLIVSNGVALYGAGASTTLTATNNANGAIELTGNGPSLSNLVVQYANPAQSTGNQPDTTPQAGGVWVQSANSYSITNVSILNSSSNDIDIFQSSNGNVSNNQIITTATMYDGIQIVDCVNLQVVNNTFSHFSDSYANVIDQLFGVISSQNLNISYNQINLEQSTSYSYSTGIAIKALLSGQITHNIISANSTSGPTGMDIGGGNSSPFGLTSNIVISGNYVTGTAFIFSDLFDSSGTNNYCTNVQITKNTLIGDSNIFNQGFIIFGGTNINFSSNAVSTISVGIHIYNPVNITVQSNEISNTSIEGVLVYGGDSVTVQSNQISNTNAEGIAIVGNINCPAGISSLIIANNYLSNCCTGSSNVINIDPNGFTITGVSIQSNYYAGPADNATYYIQSLVPGSATNPNISANTQATMLPNNLAP